MAVVHAALPAGLHAIHPRLHAVAARCQRMRQADARGDAAAHAVLVQPALIVGDVRVGAIKVNRERLRINHSMACW